MTVEADVLRQIGELERLAASVLDKKRRLRPRRPIVIEFAGSPKSGKSTCIGSLDIFLRRNGFKTKVLTERASVCPISNKFDPLFNVWTGCSSLNQLSELLDTRARDLDIVMMDRGFFDSLCWFEWQKVNGFLRDEDYRRFTDFFTAPRLRMMIDLVFVFESSTETSIEREYRNLLTRKEGSIMRKKVLEGYVAAIEQATNLYRTKFRAMESMNTDLKDQNRVSYEVTRQVLKTLNLVADEKIGYIPRDHLDAKLGTVFRYSDIETAINKHLSFEYRDKVEPDDTLVQFIPVAVFKDRSSNRFLTGRKAAKAVSASSPERDRVLLYFGGHVREEDGALFHHPTAIEVMKQCMYREVKEEIGIDIEAPSGDPYCVWVRDGSKSERHIAVVFLLERDIDEIKVVIDDDEFVRWEKKGTPGTGDIIDEAGIKANLKSMDSWSKNIVQNIVNVPLSKPKSAQQELRLS